MKRIPALLATAIFVAPVGALADEPAPPPPPRPEYAAYPEPYAPPAMVAYSAAELPPEENGPFVPQEGRGPKKGMRKAGMVLTLVGIGAAAFGGILLGASAGGRPSGEFGGAIQEGLMGIGGTFLAVGGTSMLVGIPLWAVGAASYPSSQP